MWKKRLLQTIGPIIAVGVFAGALFVLHRALHNFSYRELVSEAARISARRIAAAIFLAAISYLVLTGYDAVAFRYIHRKLEYTKVALASFLGYAFSHNLGFAVLTSTAVRYRLYSGWGLPALDIARIVAFCGWTYWLGFLVLGGFVFLIHPPVLPESLPGSPGVLRGLGVVLSPHVFRVFGAIFLAIVAAYLIWTVRAKKPIRLRDWEFAAPPIRLTLAEIVISALDWVMSASVLYALLPTSPDVGFPTVLSIFLMTQVAGLLSHVPGGLGVFETLVIICLQSKIPTTSLVGALLVYRVIYYLLPLGVALLLFSGHELLRRQHVLKRVSAWFEDWTVPIVPYTLALTTFVAGAVLLFSGSIPILPKRVDWLRHALPLPVLEVSHFLGSIAGVWLLLLARGIQRRLDAAYILTVILLTVGIITSLLKGLDYEEAILLAIMLAAFLPCRGYFHRKASLISQRQTLGWGTAMISVLVCTLWLGVFSHKHWLSHQTGDYASNVWWRFSFEHDAPRSLRAGVGALCFVLFFSMARLLRPAPARPTRPGSDELGRVEPIIAEEPSTRSNIALLGDKPLLLNDAGSAFIMYGVQGRSWISLGDPVGPKSEHAELVWRFHELCDEHAGRTVFYQVPPGSLAMYADLGLTAMKIGESACVPLESFSFEGADGKSFRQVWNKLQREGCDFSVIPREQVPSLLPELRSVSDEWLKAKGARERRFSIGYFEEDYLSHFPAALVRRGERVLAFANVWTTAGKEEISIDLMRYRADAPSGVMDFLFSQLMLWGRREGYQRFDLGMAPLAGLETHPLAPTWNRIGHFIFRHGEHFYNYQGVRQYKDKFSPLWEPRYLVCAGALALPRVLLDFAAMMSREDA